MLALLVCVLLVGLMLIGIPVCIVMGVTSGGVFAALGQGQYMAVMAQRIYAGTTGFTLLAIPFFILAGNLMNTGGITDKIFGFAKAICGHWPGGLGQVNVISSLVFSGMSGAAVADAAGLGVIEIKAMDDAGFDRTFSAGITAASSTIGPVVPPSIPFVVYSSVVGTVSVSRLFMAGFIPGFMMALAMMVAVYVISKKRNYPVEPKMKWADRWKYFVDAIPSLMTVVIIIGGIWGGVFTATEAAVVASFYALFLGTIVYKEIKVKDLVNIIYDSMVQSCKTLFIIAIANFLAYFLMHQRIPNKIINGLLNITSNRVILILLIILVLLLLGCFIEGTAVILICTPIFLPIIKQIGMDLTQFGVIMVLASMIGLLTPPVGMSLYAVSSITDVSLVDLSKAVLPYLIGIFIVLLLCAFYPPISTFLPNYFIGGA
ncbi:MAG: TRAP transporter large permease [Fusobacteriaceae bacterium]|jgi:tripartite ATP-independent transporter DctM subunit|nr:TRAP transporter large permease [Fusobacteriaceae bacterium]